MGDEIPIPGNEDYVIMQQKNKLDQIEESYGHETDTENTVKDNTKVNDDYIVTGQDLKSDLDEEKNYVYTADGKEVAIQNLVHKNEIRNMVKDDTKMNGDYILTGEGLKPNLDEVKNPTHTVDGKDVAIQNTQNNMAYLPFLPDKKHNPGCMNPNDYYQSAQKDQPTGILNPDNTANMYGQEQPFHQESRNSPSIQIRDNVTMVKVEKLNPYDKCNDLDELKEIYKSHIDSNPHAVKLLNEIIETHIYQNISEHDANQMAIILRTECKIFTLIIDDCRSKLQKVSGSILSKKEEYHMLLKLNEAVLQKNLVIYNLKILSLHQSKNKSQPNIDSDIKQLHLKKQTRIDQGLKCLGKLNDFVLCL